jgi:hypothetical protein
VAQVHGRPAEFDQAATPERHAGDRMQHRDAADRQDRDTGSPERVGDRTIRARDEGFDRVARQMRDQVQEARARAVRGGRVHHAQHAQRFARHTPESDGSGLAGARFVPSCEPERR